MKEKIDVTYDADQKQQVFDAEDSKVADRWSRYIGVLGIERSQTVNEPGMQTLPVGKALAAGVEGTHGLSPDERATLARLLRKVYRT